MRKTIPQPKQGYPSKQNLALNTFSKIAKRLNYKLRPDGSFHLLDNTTDTGIAVKRSHEGYNHFACWYVTLGDKIKKDYPLKEKNAALSKGISLYLEKFTDEILKNDKGEKYG